MINQIYEDIFNTEERQLIIDIIEKELKIRTTVDDESFVNSSEAKYIIKSLNGRLMVELLPMPENIFEKIKKIIGSSYSQLSAVYAEYSPQHNGNPSLNMHYDRYNDNLCFDYQLDSNTEWPIIIENKQFVLKNNSGLTFMTKSQYHGREEKIFKNNEYVKMLFFFFKRIENE